jgi:hypothetical protein
MEAMPGMNLGSRTSRRSGWLRRRLVTAGVENFEIDRTALRKSGLHRSQQRAAKSFPMALEGVGFIEVQIRYFGKRN